MGVGVHPEAGADAGPHLVEAGRDVEVIGAGALDEQVPRPVGDDQGERAVGPADGLDRRQVGASRVVAVRLVVDDPAAGHRRARRVLDQPAAHDPPRRSFTSTDCRTAALGHSTSRQAGTYGSPSGG